ncbi:MAG TPA: BBE domain-containing protein [Pseudonocardia sp.]|uniref:BBE domain-containing protein n=1 Tax=Pseudonocardia sp. TaxID=60912 RepID=UPI002B4B88ED|nr:BBE domain-containing protein [Pseudonocardia sp.]HLU57279.1 BBE domain-containing protein [Pseudonocardia sp.]
MVTEFEFRLHDVGPIVDFGMLFWGADQAGDALRLIGAEVPTFPRSLNVVIAATSAPPAPFVPQEHRFQPGLFLMIVGFGDPVAHAAALARMRTALPPRFEHGGPMPYVALQPHSRGPATYVTAMAEYEDHRIRAAYGDEKYERLARIKGRYDPGNVFHRNANIEPA